MSSLTIQTNPLSCPQVLKSTMIGKEVNREEQGFSNDTNREKITIKMENIIEREIEELRLVILFPIIGQG